jgi:hypothetical protein
MMVGRIEIFNQYAFYKLKNPVPFPDDDHQTPQSGNCLNKNFQLAKGVSPVSSRQIYRSLISSSTSSDATDNDYRSQCDT